MAVPRSNAETVRAEAGAGACFAKSTARAISTGLAPRPKTEQGDQDDGGHGVAGRQGDRPQQEGALGGGHDRDRVRAAVAEAASDQRAGQGALSRDVRTLWAAYDVRIRHDGVKRLQDPEVGELELTYQSVDLPVSSGPCTT